MLELFGQVKERRVESRKVGTDRWRRREVGQTCVGLSVGSRQRGMRNGRAFVAKYCLSSSMFFVVIAV